MILHSKKHEKIVDLFCYHQVLDVWINELAFVTFKVILPSLFLPACTVGRSVATIAGNVRLQSCCLCQLSRTLSWETSQLSSKEKEPTSDSSPLFLYSPQTNSCFLPLRCSSWESAYSSTFCPAHSFSLCPFHFARAFKHREIFLLLFLSRQPIMNKLSELDNKLLSCTFLLFLEN